MSIVVQTLGHVMSAAKPFLTSLQSSVLLIISFLWFTTTVKLGQISEFYKLACFLSVDSNLFPLRIKSST